MLLEKAQHITPIAFAQWVILPENVEQSFELLNGRIYEVVANGRSSILASKFNAYITMYAIQHDLGDVTGADGGYYVGNDRLIPDVGFTRKERASGETREGYFTYPPDLAVEVISPTDKPRKIRLKISAYLNAGTTVWLVDPEARIVEVYAPQQAPLELTETDTLMGVAILVGFQLELSKIFG